MIPHIRQGPSLRPNFVVNSVEELSSLQVPAVKYKSVPAMSASIIRLKKALDVIKQIQSRLKVNNFTKEVGSNEKITVK